MLFRSRTPSASTFRTFNANHHLLASTSITIGRSPLQPAYREASSLPIRKIALNDRFSPSLSPRILSARRCPLVLPRTLKSRFPLGNSPMLISSNLRSSNGPPGVGEGHPIVRIACVTDNPPSYPKLVLVVTTGSWAPLEAEKQR